MEHTKEPCKHWKLGMIDDWDNCQYCKAIADEKEYDELKQQRDDLFAILQDLREWNGDLVLKDYIDAAIVKVKEQK